MSEKQKKLVEEILGSSKQMSEPLQQRLIGVAYGLELAQSLGMSETKQDEEKEGEE